jgi:hypothetical protein
LQAGVQGEVAEVIARSKPRDEVTVTQSQLTPIMERFGQEACKKAQSETLAVFPGRWFSASVLMALGLRETNLQNICGGAVLVDGVWEPSKTDRGWLQISDTIATNAKWLATELGCPDGSWYPALPHVPAITHDFCPTFSAATKYTLAQIVSARHQAANVVKTADTLRFVVAAHNAGFAGALEGYRRGDVDLNTTHGNYSAYVLANAPVIDEWIAARPTWQWRP